jgi:hypothetical protein
MEVHTMRRLLAMSVLSALAGCGSALGPAAAPPTAQALSNNQIILFLRQNPTALTASVSSGQIVWATIDPGSVNGSYPAPTLMQSAFNALNPQLDKAGCSSIASVSESVVTPQAGFATVPQLLVGFVPKAPGSCTLSVNLPNGGRGSIALSVTQ